MDVLSAIYEWRSIKNNDGRRKNLFCIAVNLLVLNDVKDVMTQIAVEINADSLIKEKSAAVRLFQVMTEQRNVPLELRKKR